MKKRHKKFRVSFYALLWVLVGSIAIVQPVLSQDKGVASKSVATKSTPLDKTQATSKLTEEKLAARISELEKLSTPDDSAKNELTFLRQAYTFLQQTKESAVRGAQFEKEAREAPAALKEIEKELAKPLVEPQAPKEGSVSVEILSRQLEAERLKLENEKRLRTTAEDDAAFRTERRQQIPEELVAVRSRLEEIKQTLAAPPAANQPAKVMFARKNALEAERGYLGQRLMELDLESRSYDAQRDLLRARKQLAERRVLVTDREVSLLDGVVTSKRTEAGEEVKRVAEEQRRATTNAHPAVRAIAEQNETMANELAQISSRTQTLNTQKQQIDDVLTRVSKDFDSAKERVAHVGLTDTLGLRLRNQRMQLPDISEHERRLRERQNEMNRVQLRRMELEDALLELVDVNQEATRRLQAYSPGNSKQEQKEVLGAVTDALTKQKNDYYDALIKAYDIYFDSTLMSLHESERQLIDVTQKFKNFIDERILWVQSTRPLTMSDAKRGWDAVSWLLNPSSWWSTITSLGNDFIQHPFAILFSILAILTLLRFQVRFRAQLHELGQRAATIKAQFSETVVSLVLTLLIAAPSPLLIELVGLRLAAPGDSFSTALAAGFERVALLLFASELLRLFCRPMGLGEAHFHWPAASLKLVRKHLRWLVPTVLPLSFVVAVTDHQPIEVHHDSLGRIVFVIVMIAGAIFLQRMFHPDNGLLQNTLTKHRGGWLDRLKYLWFPSVVFVPLGLGLVAILGYFYTAAQLEYRVLNTIWLLLMVLVGRALMLRWLFLTQRKLAIEQARKRAKAAAETSGSADIAPAPEMPVIEPEIDVAALSSQTRKLLQIFVGSSIFIGLLLVWADVLPAFGILREVNLWTEAAIQTGAAGEASQVIQKSVTLADLGLAVVFLVLTIAVSRNLPGLLEMAVLQRLPFTPSGRYAITTIARYLLVIVGVILAFNAIGIGWSKVQWLAAAITVGLGFGLQEIFANFVSGIIMLFERPVRVGDAVTIGNISGTVTRIRMRATTITDWNRKELIIPNKEFVTGQVVNWSLSDPILRVTIPIGLAYGSDIALVTKLLMDIAKEHRHVLKDPPPNAYFLGFGESTLNFELRVFIPNYEEMFPVRHELLQKIDSVFQENKLQIAFPQRDIHIRWEDAKALSETLRGTSLPNPKDGMN